MDGTNSTPIRLIDRYAAPGVRRHRMSSTSDQRHSPHGRSPDAAPAEAAPTGAGAQMTENIWGKATAGNDCKQRREICALVD
jgi:hypothetical protein